MLFTPRMIGWDNVICELACWVLGLTFVLHVCITCFMYFLKSPELNLKLKASLLSLMHSHVSSFLVKVEIGSL